ncbi:YceI family protein [Streptomyces sp. NPDC090741]|uniref:YceI family protein n=1 Tax=Streptomyces sp. NPDC090741 TaxID=3365967 RepID=UPI0037F1B77B
MGRNLGPRRCAGFVTTTRIDRHDFGVNWNDVVDRGGVVVSAMVDVTVDVEAVHETERGVGALAAGQAGSSWRGPRGVGRASGGRRWVGR